MTKALIFWRTLTIWTKLIEEKIDVLQIYSIMAWDIPATSTFESSYFLSNPLHHYIQLFFRPYSKEGKTVKHLI
ncbi:hypothetical protein AB0R75_04710 [Bacillus pumilus]|jgi:hypothetical protein|uniref:hypothetical protein n=1 Tax=Bacillus TaxID=1386 RepID=UPI0011A86E38|nr:hypothetical protein [Bacillus pumilus]MBQ4815979.1 hypothetical protein [Bacillus pumilus]WIG32974.1 hypothetical protein QPL77_04770 [Bacillus pumilus]